MRRFWLALLTKVVLRKWLHVSGFAFRVIYLMLILFYFVSRGQTNDQMPEGFFLLCWFISGDSRNTARAEPVGVNSYILKFLTELSPHCVYNFVFYPLKVSARGENVSFFFSGGFCCYVGCFIFFLAASLVQLILLLDLLSFA